MIARTVAGADRNTLRQLADQLLNKLKSGVVVLGSATDGKVSLIVMVSDDLTGRLKANEVIPPVARLVAGAAEARQTWLKPEERTPTAWRPPSRRHTR